METYPIRHIQVQVNETKREEGGNKLPLFLRSFRTLNSRKNVDLISAVKWDEMTRNKNKIAVGEKNVLSIHEHRDGESVNSNFGWIPLKSILQ